MSLQFLLRRCAALADAALHLFSALTQGLCLNRAPLSALYEAEERTVVGDLHVVEVRLHLNRWFVYPCSRIYKIRLISTTIYQWPQTWSASSSLFVDACAWVFDELFARLE